MIITKLKDLPEFLKTEIFFENEKENRRYCIGQPQLNDGQYIFTDNISQGLNFIAKNNYFSFPTLIIDCT